MKFTKKQRHEIYKVAKKMLSYRISKGYYSMGLCTLIERATYKLYAKWIMFENEPNLLNEFPEFAAAKPEEAGVFWWDRDNVAIREEKLDQFIKITKPK